MKKMIFLYNPRSGKEMIKGHLADIVDIFCRAGYLPSVYVTCAAGDAEQIAKEYGEETELFVCGGGDGTLNGVVSGLMKLQKKPKLGYLPAGSTNDFARSLKIPTDLKQAAREAVGGKDVKIDIGSFGDEKYFVYIAAFGAFTDVSYKTPQDMKNVLGHPAYILEGVKSLSSLKPHFVKITWDDGETEGDFIYGMVTNTTSVGGFTGLTPRDVSFHDGMFEGVFIRMPKTPADLADIISCVFQREENNENVLRIRSSRVAIHAEEELSWTLDGEYGGSMRDTVIENRREALTISCGQAET